VIEELKISLQNKQEEMIYKKREFNEINHHNVTLIDKVNFLENAVSESESKNKRLNEMVNDSVINKVQAYKENVLSKLLDKKRPGPIIDGTFGNERVNSTERKLFSGHKENMSNMSFMPQMKREPAFTEQ
jgi:hypothetical protein